MSYARTERNDFLLNRAIPLPKLFRITKKAIILVNWHGNTFYGLKLHNLVWVEEGWDGFLTGSGTQQEDEDLFTLVEFFDCQVTLLTTNRTVEALIRVVCMQPNLVIWNENRRRWNERRGGEHNVLDRAIERSVLAAVRQQYLYEWVDEKLTTVNWEEEKAMCENSQLATVLICYPLISFINKMKRHINFRKDSNPRTSGWKATVENVWPPFVRISDTLIWMKIKESTITKYHRNCQWKVLKKLVLHDPAICDRNRIMDSGVSSHYWDSMSRCLDSFIRSLREPWKEKAPQSEYWMRYLIMIIRHPIRMDYG